MSFALLTLLPLFWGCSANEAPLAGTPVDPAVLFEHSTFADAALELEVRSLLGRPRGELSTAELNSIEILDAGRKGIEDLTGIDRLANLRVLRLSANAFSDINPLQMLKRLEELDLGQNNITDAGGLTALGTLQVLVLSNNQLTEIGPLAQLTRLRQLDLDRNQISNLAPLRGLKLLRLLNFDDNFVRDLSALEALPALRRVELSGNPIDPEILAPLRKRGIQVGFYLPPLGIGDDILEEEIRETLGIETGEISDANLRMIQSLTLRGAVSSIRGIERLINLRNFSVTGVRATLNDISPLSDLFRLREVSIFNTELTSLQGLFQLRLLRRLRLDANRIEDLSPLGRLTGVNDMSLGTNQIRDVFPLRRLIRMVKLNLNNNEIRDLGPLVKLINLEELNFNRNEVSSLAFIANMQKLRVLNCSTNLIEDISPLLDLPALTRVSLQGNPLSEEAKAHARELTDRGVTVIGSR